MILLFETSLGYAFFKVLKDSIIEEKQITEYVSKPELISKVLQLKHFEKFKDTADALSSITKIMDGKLPKNLKKAMKSAIKESTSDTLLVSDMKLAASIQEKLNFNCIASTNVQSLMRCVREQFDNLINELPKKEMVAMTLGLAHSLSRYKLKFSADKIDTMIIQAVCLLDDLDKELNNYVMRCREWYGWHFPELGKVVSDNLTFVKIVKTIGTRENTTSTDLSEILEPEVEEKVKSLAETSMGTEILEEDIENIRNLCDQIISITNYKTQLRSYLDSRMLTIAPNLTVLVGTLIGARLISKAGSLQNLAKYPASTIQILGAEKSLFRALKAKKSTTPKHGLIYHADLVQASLKNKGKMARMLAAKMSLTIRYDAYVENKGEEEDEEKKDKFKIGIDFKAKLEFRLKSLEDRSLYKISGSGKTKAKFEKYHGKPEVKRYPSVLDSTVKSITNGDNDIKTEVNNGAADATANESIETAEPEEDSQVAKKSSAKKLSKKRKREELEMADESVKVEENGGSTDALAIDQSIEITEPEDASEKKSSKKKKRRQQQDAETSAADAAVEVVEPVDNSSQMTSEKKSPKNKKRKQQQQQQADVDETTSTAVTNVDTSVEVAAPENSSQTTETKMSKKKKRRLQQQDASVDETAATARPAKKIKLQNSSNK